MKKMILTFLCLPLFSQAVLAQATQSLSLNLEKVQQSKTTEGDPQLKLDLMGEAQRQNPGLPQFDLQSVELNLKSGIGGASTYLLVNGRVVDSQSVETDPDLLVKPGGEAKVSLKNIERRVTTAVLSIIGTSSLKSVTLLFGAIEDTVILGKYADKEASKVAAAKPADDRAASLAVRPPAELRPRPKSEEGMDVVPTPTPDSGPLVITPPAQQPSKVAPRKRGAYPPRDCVLGICIGDNVRDRYGRVGSVTGVYEFDDLIYVRFGRGARPELVDPTQVRLY